MNPSALLPVRQFRSLGLSRNSVAGAVAFASAQGWDNEKRVVACLKAAVTANDRTDGAALLTDAGVAFAQFVRPQTILGKLAGLRKVPARVRLLSMDTGAIAYWSGESAPIALSAASLSGETMEPLAVNAMVVATSELLRSSDPAAEGLLGDDLKRACALAVDEAFIDISNAGIPGVKPASITNGVTPIASTGAGLAAIDADLAAMVAALSAAGSTLESAAWIMRSRTAAALSMLRATSGNPAFPGVTVTGGVLFGLPVVVSDGVPLAVADSTITLVDAAWIVVIDSDDTVLEVGESASIEMSDAPSGSGPYVSMFQINAAALKMSRHVNWRVAKAGGVQVLSGVAY